MKLTGREMQGLRNQEAPCRRRGHLAHPNDLAHDVGAICGGRASGGCYSRMRFGVVMRLDAPKTRTT